MKAKGRRYLKINCMTGPISRKRKSRKLSMIAITEVMTMLRSRSNPAKKTMRKSTAPPEQPPPLLHLKDDIQSRPQRAEYPRRDPD